MINVARNYHRKLAEGPLSLDALAESSQPLAVNRFLRNNDPPKKEVKQLNSADAYMP